MEKGGLRRKINRTFEKEVQKSVLSLFGKNFKRETKYSLSKTAKKK